MFHRKSLRQRCMRGPRGGMGWGGERAWGRHGGRHGGGRGRMFDQGDLRLVAMWLLGDKPRHGYELIKEIEAHTGGLYAPSPGVIYPLLTMLEEMGLATVETHDGKKLYELTQAGQEELAGNREAAERLLARLASVKERARGERAPQIVRAIENLKLALRLRAEREISEEQAQAIAAAIDAAAQAIERS